MPLSLTAGFTPLVSPSSPKFSAACESLLTLHPMPTSKLPLDPFIVSTSTDYTSLISSFASGFSMQLEKASQPSFLFTHPNHLRLLSSNLPHLVLPFGQTFCFEVQWWFGCAHTRKPPNPSSYVHIQTTPQCFCIICLQLKLYLFQL